MNTHREHIAQGNQVVGDRLSSVVALSGCPSAQANERKREQAHASASRQKNGTRTLRAAESTEQEPTSEQNKRLCGVSQGCDANVGATVGRPDAGAASTYPVEIEIVSACPSWPDHQTDSSISDLVDLHGLFDQDMAPNTITNYRAQWNSFVSWTREKKDFVPFPPNRPKSPHIWQNVWSNTGIGLPRSGLPPPPLPSYTGMQVWRTPAWVRR